MEAYTKSLRTISLQNIQEVGSKNAFLGEIFTHVKLKGIRVPEGFAITATAYKHFIEYNKLDGVHAALMKKAKHDKRFTIKQIGEKARALIMGARMPGHLYDAIIAAYHDLNADPNLEVAVRSSPIYPDLFNITEKDQHETILNVRGEKALIASVKECFASLYSDKALRAGVHNDAERAISVCVQKMIRADKACSGFVYTADPVSGFIDVIHVSGVWGLGEKMLEERITPDQFIIYKPLFPLGKKAIIQKKLGSKSRMLIYKEESNGVKVTEILSPADLREKFILSDDEILIIANWGMILESYYNSTMSMEWAKDGYSQDLYLLQAKPKNFKQDRVLKEYDDI